MLAAGVLVGVVLVTSAGAAAWGAPAAHADEGFRVRIARAAVASAVKDALTGASERLRRDGCATIFGDFADGGGHTLQANLDALGRSGVEYLTMIGFYDGQGVGRCQSSGIMAVTSPGSRSVFVCDGFALAQKRDPGMAEVVLLHEALHSLGLEENPPSSLEITERVVSRCGR